MKSSPPSTSSRNSFSPPIPTTSSPSKKARKRNGSPSSSPATTKSRSPFSNAFPSRRFIDQDDVAEFIDETQDCKPESGVPWLHEFLADVKNVYDFQHLQGAETEDGGNALHALRSHLWERGDAILQADNEGFTNEEGFHIVWQFADTVSGAWNMAVLQDGTWHQFKMDLGDPDHRDAFFRGDIPPDAASMQLARSEGPI